MMMLLARILKQTLRSVTKRCRIVPCIRNKSILFDIQTKEAEPEPESEEIPCIYCAELFKGKKGLERHEKYCILKKQFDK